MSKRSLGIFLIVTLLTLAGIVSPTFAAYGLKPYNVDVVDQFDRLVTDSVTMVIYVDGTTDAAVLYTDTTKATTVTTELTANTDGMFSFWYDVAICDLLVTNNTKGYSITYYDMTPTDHKVVLALSATGTVAAGESSLTFTQDSAELGDYKIISTNTGVANNDYLRVSFYAEDDGSVATEIATIDVMYDDVTSNSEDVEMEFSVITAGSLAAELNLNGAALFPEADEGLDLGKTALEFKDIWSDGVIYSDQIDLIGSLILANDETVTNATDAVVTITADDDAAELLDFQLLSSNTGVANSDYIRMSFHAEDDGSVATELATIDVMYDDVTSNSEDVEMEFSVITAASLAAELNLNGAALFPEADEGLDLGKSGTEFKDVYSDGVIYSDQIDVEGSVILANDETIANATDAVVSLTFDDDAAELGDIQIISSNEATAANDYLRLSYYVEDDGSVKTEVANIDVDMDDVTSNSEDSTMEFSVITAGSLVAELNLTGAMLAPEADGGLDLGSSGKSFNDLHVQGNASLYTITDVTSLNTHDEIRVFSHNYFDEDVAASQSTAQWGLQAGADVGGSIQGFAMPLSGSVIGVSVYSNASCTSGTLTADVTIDGTATGLQAGLNSVDDADTSATMQGNDTDAVVTGDIIGVEITTSSVWAPTTADVVVTIFVEY